MRGCSDKIEFIFTELKSKIRNREWLMEIERDTRKMNKRLGCVLYVRL